jgi:hypothetical protein
MSVKLSQRFWDGPLASELPENSGVSVLQDRLACKSVIASGASDGVKAWHRQDLACVELTTGTRPRRAN